MKTLITIFQDHFTYRKQILKLAKSDLIKTYRGAALGWGWAIFKPVITIFVYWFAFSIGLRKGGDMYGYPFFLWLIAGMIPWFYISETFTLGTSSIKTHKYLVTKLRFPVSTIPTFVSLSRIFIQLFLQVITIFIFVLWGYPLDIYFIQLPLYIFALFMFFTVLSFFNALVASVYGDYGNLVKSIVTAVFWMSGVLWDSNRVQIPWLRSLLLMNPVTYICTGFRNVYIYKRWFWQDDMTALAFLGLFGILSVLSCWMYNKTRKDLPDVL